MDRPIQVKTFDDKAVIDLHELLVPIVRLFLGVDVLLNNADEIVKEAANRHNADIATLFQVEKENHLALKGAFLRPYVHRGIPIDKPLEAFVGRYYEIPWGAQRWEEIPGMGITAGVAALNISELPIDSYEELEKYAAHRKLWDDSIYPFGQDDEETGFGCLHAVPLRINNNEDRKKSVIGVFKIERRIKSDKFNRAERDAIAVMAQLMNRILRDAYENEQLIREKALEVLREMHFAESDIKHRTELLAQHAKNRQNAAFKASMDFNELWKDLPEERDWIRQIVDRVRRSLGEKTWHIPQIIKLLRDVSLQAPSLTIEPPREERFDLIKKAFSAFAVSQGAKDAALENIKQWYVSPIFSDYRAQLKWLIEEEKWDVLLDSFYRVLPFGTGGRRGPVGIGPNRFNPFTLESSVQGHVKYMREHHPNKDLSVIMAYDVRGFHDLRGIYNPNISNPLLGLTSRQFAHLAAGVYAANDVKVWMLPQESDPYLSTPELSFIIRDMGADGGLNISASHNHPDDNGGKFYISHGGQEVPPNDQEIAERVEEVRNFYSLPLNEAQAIARIEQIPKDIHKKYIDLNIKQSLYPEKRNACIVFTPLHGTGTTSVGEVLQRAGFTIYFVPEQSAPDGYFPGVPFRIPNPEVRESMQAAIGLARKVDADVVFACDPDADRIGAYSKTKGGEYQFLSGNEIAVLVTHFKLESLQKQNRLPAHPLVIKTEVTTDLLSEITKSFGGTIIGDLLVGFKYHADVLYKLEKEKCFRQFKGNLDDFIIAVEESHGVLVTHELRDKDAAGPAILLAELASLECAEGRTIIDYLHKIYLRYGYFGNLLRSLVMSGAIGMDHIKTIQDVLRQRGLSKIADQKVIQIIDHQDEKGIHGPFKSDTDRIARNVLVFQLENGASVTIRPSGTEPKIKIYIQTPSNPLGEDADREKLLRRIAEVDCMSQHIANDFIKQILSVISVMLPDYALRISDLVPLDKRIEFVSEFLPGLEIRAKALIENETSKEEISKWINARLRTYGQDAKGLVAEAVDMYLDHEQKIATGLTKEDMRRRGACIDAIRTFF
jgi:phosphoglucomutase